MRKPRLTGDISLPIIQFCRSYGGRRESSFQDPELVVQPEHTALREQIERGRFWRLPDSMQQSTVTLDGITTFGRKRERKHSMENLYRLYRCKYYLP